MDLSFVNNLFLGRQELDFFKSSVKTEGFQKAFQQIIKSYGIVKLPLQDPTFNYLRVIPGSSPTELTISAGVAIDKHMNIIHVKNNLIDEIVTPSDTVTRYIIIKYAQNTEEVGTVNVDIDGTLTGNLTEFTKRLRGLPDFPAKISFPNSAGNTGEYTIQAITDDTNAQLNIASGLMVAEAGLKYKVVGTFTPGIPIPLIDKFPFKNDGYEIRIDVSDVLIPGEEFLLAEVSSDGVATTIIDRRLDTILEISPADSELPSSSNPLIGVELIQSENSASARDTSRVKIGWGFKASVGNWTYSTSLNQITITAGSGGSFPSTAAHTPGDFNNWNVFLKETGKIVRVVTSSNTGPNIVLQLEPTGAIPTAGDITVIPKATQIEIITTNATNPNANKKYLFDVFLGEGFCSVFTATAAPVKFQYRHINGNKSTPIIDINDGAYLNESSFNDVGTQIASSLSAVTAATITPIPHIDNFFSKKAWIDRKNVFAAMQQFNQGTQILYPAAATTITMGDTGNLYEIVIGEQNAYWMTTKPEGTFAFLALRAGASSSIRFHLIGGAAVAPGFSRFTFAIPDPGQSYQEYDQGDVLMLIHTGGRWKLIGSMTSVGAYKQFLNLTTRINTIEGAWTDVPTIFSNVYQNDSSGGLGTDIPLNGALGTQAPQAGSYLRYKVIGKTCHVSYRLVDIIVTDHATAPAASIKIIGVLPASRDNYYGTSYVDCHSHGAVMSGVTGIRMYSGGQDLIIFEQGLASSNSFFNREYTFSSTTSVTLQATATTVINPRFTITGSFTYELP